MVDPMFPGAGDTLLHTNIVANVLQWNVIGCTFSLFMFMFEGVLHMHGENGVTIMGYESFSGMSQVVMIFLSTVLIGWCLFVPFSFVNATYGCGTFFIPTVFMGYVLYHVMSEQSRIKKNNPYPARKRIVFWTAYTISVPFIAQCMDMLVQRRDWLLNWTIFFSIVVVGLCSIAIEMVQSAYEYAAVNNSNNTDAKPYNAVALRTFCRRKNIVIRLIILCTGLIVLASCLATFPVFPATPFSNAYMTLILVAFLLTLPLVSSARHLVEVSGGFAARAARVCLILGRHD